MSPSLNSAGSAHRRSPGAGMPRHHALGTGSRAVRRRLRPGAQRSSPKLPARGGSVDLAGHQHHHQRGEVVRPAIDLDQDYNADWYGRVGHFGIREHAMGSILSGIKAPGPTRAFGGTFLRFSYMAVRRVADDIDIITSSDARLDRSQRGRTHPPTDRTSSPGVAGPSRSCRWFAG